MYPVSFVDISFCIDSVFILVYVDTKRRMLMAKKSFSFISVYGDH